MNRPAGRSRVCLNPGISPPAQRLSGDEKGKAQRAEDPFSEDYTIKAPAPRDEKTMTLEQFKADSYMDEYFIFMTRPEPGKKVVDTKQL